MLLGRCCASGIDGICAQILGSFLGLCGMFRFRSLRGRVAVVVVVVGGWLSFLIFEGELSSAGGGGGGSGGMIGKCMPFRGRGAASGEIPLCGS